jgi:hypothetical protein
MLAALCVAASLTGCGQDRQDSGQSRDTAASTPRTSQPTAPTAGPPDRSAGVPVVGPSGQPCQVEHSFDDPARDSRSWILPAPTNRRPAPPSDDLRQLGLRVDASGLCVKFTTGAPLADRSELSFVARGPMVQQPGGAMTVSGYGVLATLRDGGLAMYYGLDGRRPNQVRGSWSRDGDNLSISLPRSELDRAPTNMGNRPPFPLDGFTFEARVTSPFAAGVQEADFLPEERGGALGIVDGHVCAAPCTLPSQSP